MTYRIQAPKNNLQARISLPASKSISNRALMLHALCGSHVELQNLSDCDDTRVMLQALNHPTDVVDILAAGTAMRFLTAYFSLQPGTKTLTGTARMKQRPIHLLVNALRQLGADIRYVENEGYPPLCITGRKLTGCEVTLAGNISSQYISALLMIAPALPEGLTLHLTGQIISRPYIDLTLMLMQDFGAQAAWIDGQTIRVKPDRYVRETSFYIESDWSAASYWYEMLALKAMERADRNQPDYLELDGLFPHSGQGDSRVADVFAKLGIHTAFTSQGARLTIGDLPSTRLDEDLTDIPDLAQTFAVTCCLMNIPFCFSGVQSLRIKETDRLTALINELHKLGYVLQAEGDRVLRWNGDRCQPQPHPVIHTYDDHRMAMAFAPAALRCPDLYIEHPEVVTKSYPRYWQHLQTAGFTVTEATPGGE